MSGIYGNSGPIQTEFFNAPLLAYPGQLAYASPTLAPQLFYFNETDVFPGRGVVKGALTTTPVINRPNNIVAPFHIKAPVIASVAADFVGIAIRAPLIIDGLGSDNVAVYGANPEGTFTRAVNVAVKSAINQTFIYVQASVNITSGDPVFMAVNPVNAANIEVGEFHNVAGAGLIALTFLTWYLTQLADHIGILTYNA